MVDPMVGLTPGSPGSCSLLKCTLYLTWWMMLKAEYCVFFLSGATFSVQSFTRVLAKVLYLRHVKTIERI